MTEVGRVRALYRYPVKSMGGEAREAVTLGWPGIEGDRQYAFLRSGNASRFPWLTGREVHALPSWRARYLDPEDPRRSPVEVATSEGVVRPLGDPALLAELRDAAAEEVQLLQLGRGAFDSMPVSVVATATAGLLGERGGRPVDLRRFRPNIIVETKAGEASRETGWLGGMLVFGDGKEAVRLRANVAIKRCVMITIDPDTAARDRAIMKRVAGDFDNQIGIYCTADAIGRIAVGDRVRLVRPG